jgi:hypothetical protein
MLNKNFTPVFSKNESSKFSEYSLLGFLSINAVSDVTCDHQTSIACRKIYNVTIVHRPIFNKNILHAFTVKALFSSFSQGKHYDSVSNMP